MTAYSLAFGGLLLLGGRLSDLLGRRRVLIIGIAGFALASAVRGAATGFVMLVAARAVQGASGALLAPAALSLLTTTFTDPSIWTGPAPSRSSPAWWASSTASPRYIHAHGLSPAAQAVASVRGADLAFLVRAGVLAGGAVVSALLFGPGRLTKDPGASTAAAL